MNHKNRQAALTHMTNHYHPKRGVTWQYATSKRWNWATEGAGCFTDILNTLNEDGTATLNPDARPGYRIKVENVKFHDLTA